MAETFMSYSNSNPETDLRRHPRRICSVLSQVFVLTGDSRRYVGSGLVLDISESGLALMMDQPPAADGEVFIKNSYFDVQAEIRNRRVENDCTRLGLEFTSAVNWHATPDALPMVQPSSSERRVLKEAKVSNAAARTHDPVSVYRKFLDALESARSRLPDTLRRALRPHEQDIPAALGTALRCDFCKQQLLEPMAAPDIALYIPLRVCTSCVADAAPFASR